MKFDNAIREGYNTYLVSEESGHVQIPVDVFKRAVKVAYDALGSTSYGENEQLMTIYHDNYMDLAAIARDAGIQTPELVGTDEEDETQKEAEEFDSVNASALDKALNLGRHLKSSEINQATQRLHGTVVQKIKDAQADLE